MKIPDKTIFISGVIIAAGIFLPWFPGSILDLESPLSLCQMLMRINDLEIDFLDSFNILRMALLIPLSAILICLLAGFRSAFQKSILLPILIFCVTSACLTAYIIKATDFGLWTWLLCSILILAYGLYCKRLSRQRRAADASYLMALLLICVSIPHYLLDLYYAFYANLEAFHYDETAGFWIACAVSCALVLSLFADYLKRSEDLAVIAGAVVLAVLGYYAAVEPLYLSGPMLFLADNLEIAGIHAASHIQIVSVSLGIAMAVGVPAGILITRSRTAADIVLYIASIIITIPSIALFGFMMPVLSSIDETWDAVSGIGIGKVPAIIALALYALLPIIRNTYIAIVNIDPATIEAGKGMGMTRFQLLRLLQLPLAAPVIMAGIRTAVVMGIAIAAIAAYIGAGGLGLFVSEGLQMATNDSVIIGAVSMSLLAIAADILLGRAEVWLTPAGIKVSRS